MKNFKTSFSKYANKYSVFEYNTSYIISFIAHLFNINKFISGIEKLENDMYKINVSIPSNLFIYQNTNDKLPNYKKGLDINKITIKTKSSIDCKYDKYCMNTHCTYKHPRDRDIKIILLVLNYLMEYPVSIDFINNIKNNCKATGRTLINKSLYKVNNINDEEGWTVVV